MLNEWINPIYSDKKRINEIKNNFKASKPYPNFALSAFFNSSRLLKLRNEIIQEKFEKIEKDLFSLSHTKDLASSENKAIRDFHSFLSSKEFVLFMENLTGEKLSCRIDMQSHIMEQGDYLLFHDDVVEGRSIAYIIYLETLNTRDGGKLRLYDVKKPLHPVKEIVPTFNTFACFEVSSKSLHDVEEVKSKKQRLTIGGWFYGY